MCCRCPQKWHTNLDHLYQEGVDYDQNLVNTIQKLDDRWTGIPYLNQCDCPYADLTGTMTFKDAEMCGHSEMTASEETDSEGNITKPAVVASVPPKKYLVATTDYERVIDRPTLYYACLARAVITAVGRSVTEDMGDPSGPTTYIDPYDENGDCINIVSFTSCSGHSYNGYCLSGTYSRTGSLQSRGGFSSHLKRITTETYNGTDCSYSSVVNTVTDTETEQEDLPDCFEDATYFYNGNNPTQNSTGQGFTDTSTPTSSRTQTLSTTGTSTLRSYDAADYTFTSEGKYTTVTNLICTGETTLTAPAQTTTNSHLTSYALSVEDSEAAALDRADEEEFTLSTSAISNWEQRTTSFQFTKQEAKFSIKLNNLTKGVTYEICAGRRKRKSFSGTVPDGVELEPNSNKPKWEKLSPFKTEYTATKNGEVTLPDEDVTLVEGYEYQVFEPVLVYPKGKGCECLVDQVEVSENEGD